MSNFIVGRLLMFVSALVQVNLPPRLDQLMVRALSQGFDYRIIRWRICPAGLLLCGELQTERFQ